MMLNVVMVTRINEQRDEHAHLDHHHVNKKYGYGSNDSNLNQDVEGRNRVDEPQQNGKQGGDKTEQGKMSANILVWEAIEWRKLIEYWTMSLTWFKHVGACIYSIFIDKTTKCEYSLWRMICFTVHFTSRRWVWCGLRSCWNKYIIFCVERVCSFFFRITGIRDGWVKGSRKWTTSKCINKWPTTSGCYEPKKQAKQQTKKNCSIKKRYSDRIEVRELRSERKWQDSVFKSNA